MLKIIKYHPRYAYGVGDIAEGLPEEDEKLLVNGKFAEVIEDGEGDKDTDSTDKKVEGGEGDKDTDSTDKKVETTKSKTVTEKAVGKGQVK